MSTGDDGPIVASGPAFARQRDGAVPLRQEIRDMSHDKKLWTLYLLGLKGFQEVKEDDPLSYYQIAGIHGMPHQKWPNRDWNTMQPNPDSQFGGFCTHNSILFLPWHRPYLALFEQEVYRHVSIAGKKLAEELNDKTWTSTAENFRLPYWDWAVPSKGAFPSEALSETVSIIQPGTKGKEQPMSNPLYSYKFSSVSEDGNVNGAGITWRLADDWKDTAIAGALTRRFKQSFEREAQRYREKNLTERVLYMLQGYSQYGPFSNDAFRGTGQPGTYGSLEGIHNSIHNICGGGGNMSDPDVASFDPIFWLHHCNVDRLFAIWQELHGSETDPNTYVQPQKANEGDFNTAAEGSEDAKTDLMPFWKDAKSFFNSTDARRTQNFGYVYPETQFWRFKDQASFRDDVKSQLVLLYPAASLANIVREKQLSAIVKVQQSVPMLKGRAESHLRTAALLKAIVPVRQGQDKPASSEHHDSQRPLPTSSAPATHAPAHTDVPSLAAARASAPAPAAMPANRKVEDLIHDAKYLEWIVNIKASKHEFGKSFNVHVFLGPVPEDESIFYPLAEGHVGTFSVFARSNQSNCARCKQQQRDHLQVTDQILLTVALVERYLAGQLDSLQPDAVVPYLQQNLHWRITYANGVSIDRQQARGVLVSVISNEVTLPSGPEQLPTYAQEVHVYPEITTLPDGFSPRGSGTGLTNVAQA